MTTQTNKLLYLIGLSIVQGLINIAYYLWVILQHCRRSIVGGVILLLNTQMRIYWLWFFGYNEICEVRLYNAETNKKLLLSALAAPLNDICWQREFQSLTFVCKSRCVV